MYIFSGWLIILKSVPRKFITILHILIKATIWDDVCEYISKEQEGRRDATQYKWLRKGSMGKWNEPMSI